MAAAAANITALHFYLCGQFFQSYIMPGYVPNTELVGTAGAAALSSNTDHHK